MGHVLPREEVECTLSHIKQLRQKQRQQKREARDGRREHRREMRDLVDSFEGGLEETAARSVWARDIASQQNEQRESKVRRDIADHRNFYSEGHFFPFESKQGKPGRYDDPVTHGDKLLLQAEEDRRRDALRLMVEGVKNSSAAGLLASSMPAELPRGVASVASAVGRQEANHRNATRIAVELRLKQVQQQQQKERYTARMMHNLERSEVEHAQRGVQNQQQLRQVLSLQAADKVGRDLRDHVKLFGEHGSILPTEGWDRVAAVHVAKQALQDQIVEKQRERKVLRRAERSRAKQFNAATEQQKALLDAQESSALQQQRAELRLAWAKQEGALRAQRRGEAARSHADQRKQQADSFLTADPRGKIGPE